MVISQAAEAHAIAQRGKAALSTCIGSFHLSHHAVAVTVFGPKGIQERRQLLAAVEYETLLGPCHV